MRKLLLGICLIVLFIFAGCASSKMAFAFDPEIPEDQMSALWIPNYVKVTQFGGRTVEWIAPPLSLTSVRAGVPSGEYTFIIETVIVGSNANGIPVVKDQSFTKYFETGKGYQLILQNGKIILLDL